MSGRSGRVRAVLLTLAGAGLGLLVLCGALVVVVVTGERGDPGSPTLLSRLTAPLALGGLMSLGAITVPDGAVATTAKDHRWRFDWRRYQLDFGIDDAVLLEVRARHRRLARRMHVEEDGREQFRWDPPPACGDEPWSCVYRQTASDNRPYVVELARAFARHQRLRGLDARAMVELVVSWVQHIAYRVPGHEAFGVLPATRVAAEGWGDCDSKALLAALVLDELGVKTVLLRSASFKHAALGVAVPAQGESWRHQGERYFYVEVTSPGWALGTLPPAVNVPRAWAVVPWK